MVALTAGMDALDAPLDVTRQVGVVGVVAAAVLVLATIDGRRATAGRDRPLPAAGVVLAAAALVAIAAADDADPITAALVLGVAAAAAGLWVTAWLGLPWWARPLLVLPGAALAVDAVEITDRPSVAGPAIVAGAVLAVLVGEADRTHAGTAVAPPLLAVSIFGMYATIPETRQILPVLVVAVPVALVGGPLRLARLGAPGAAAMVVLLAALVAQGGEPRPASIVGGLAALGVLVLDPVARVLVRSPTAVPDGWTSLRLLAFVAVHVTVVLVAARIAGLRQDPVVATAIVAVIAGVALVALVVMAREVERSDGDG